MSVAIARKLRREQTEAESKLWSRLRNRSLDGLKWRRQVPLRGKIADFLCMDARLIVEVDGGQHAELEAADAARTEVLEKACFLVVRFWNGEVIHQIDMVLDVIIENVSAARRRFPDGAQLPAP